MAISNLSTILLNLRELDFQWRYRDPLIQENNSLFQKYLDNPQQLVWLQRRHPFLNAFEFHRQDNQ